MDDGEIDIQCIVNTMRCLIKIDCVDYRFTVVILDSFAIHVCPHYVSQIFGVPVIDCNTLSLRKC